MNVSPSPLIIETIHSTFKDILTNAAFHRALNLKLDIVSKHNPHFFFIRNKLSALNLDISQYFVKSSQNFFLDVS